MPAHPISVSAAPWDSFGAVRHFEQASTCSHSHCSPVCAHSSWQQPLQGSRHELLCSLKTVTGRVHANRMMHIIHITATIRNQSCCCCTNSLQIWHCQAHIWWYRDGPAVCRHSADKNLCTCQIMCLTAVAACVVEFLATADGLQVRSSDASQRTGNCPRAASGRQQRCCSACQCASQVCIDSTCRPSQGHVAIRKRPR